MKADEKRARIYVQERAGGDPTVGLRGLCEVTIPGVPCTTWGTDWHHRKNRSQGGKWCPSNGLLLCANAHRFITEHPNEAKAKGWAVHPAHDPASVPVMYRDYPRPQMLGADGSIRDATDAELIALLGFGYTVGGEVG